MSNFASSRAVRFLRKDDGAYLQELAARSEARLGALEQRRTLLLPAFVFGLVATILVWILALAFPQTSSRLYSGIMNSNLPRYGTLLTILAMAIPFAPPFVTVFALGNMLRPADDQESMSGVMAGFACGQKANQRWFILMAAGIAGAVNCFLLLVALLIATGN